MIPRDADDLHRFGVEVAAVDHAAHRRAVRPVLLRHGLVDHSHAAPVGHLVFSERAAGDDGHADDEGIVDADRHRVGRGLVLVGGVVPWNLDAVHVDVGREGQPRCRRHAGDTRQPSQRPCRLSCKRCRSLVVVAVHPEIERERRDRRRIETEIHGPRDPQAADEQRARDEEHQRQGELPDDEDIPHREAAAARASADSLAPARARASRRTEPAPGRTPPRSPSTRRARRAGPSGRWRNRT